MNKPITVESVLNQMVIPAIRKTVQVVDDLDFLHDEDEESLEEIASRENHFINSQEPNVL